MDILEELAGRGAILTDKHFVYKSGKHGSGYINFDPAFPDVQLVWDVCQAMVEPFLGDYDTVVAPATGGIVLAEFCGLATVHQGYSVKATWADKDDSGSFVFERDGAIKAIWGKRVLVVDDVMTNANEDGSVFKVCRLVEQHGGTVIGVSLVCNRCGGSAQDLRVPELRQLSNTSFEAIPAEKCPLCKQAVPIVEDIGHGAAYKHEHPAYPGGYERVLSTT